jgi:FkbM family methyltransferase
MYLEYISGIIHVGANAGQERELYAQHDLDVLWMEPIPEVFSVLVDNLRSFPKQRAVNALLSNEDDQLTTLHVASNQGISSSVLELGKHQQIFPEIHYVDSILLSTVTLPTLLSRERINSQLYQAILLDVQGLELRVLEGSVPILHNFDYIQLEVADFESYQGCCKLEDVEEFLSLYGYRELDRVVCPLPVGNYYEMIYRRKSLQ